MYLIVGLGNPGMRYRSTYHNLGFMVVDAIARLAKIKFTGKESSALTAKGKSANGAQFVVAKPQTYMNKSGESVRPLMRKYCDDESELIVIYDDADLPVGRMRLREEGSSGTHNGMRSIVKELETTNFKRLRIGIRNQELADKEVAIFDYVLSKIDYASKKTLEKCIQEAAQAMLSIVSGEDIQRVEERLNRRKIGGAFPYNFL